jgi:hypothetical protein
MAEVIIGSEIHPIRGDSANPDDKPLEEGTMASAGMWHTPGRYPKLLPGHQLLKFLVPPSQGLP